MSLIAKQGQTPLSPGLLDEEQQRAVDRLYGHDATFLVAGMGAGKTVVALTAIAELIEAGELSRVVVFAPLKVAVEVWRQEAAKWAHTAGLDVVLCRGTPVQRRELAEGMRRGVLVVSMGLMSWFCDTVGGYDGLVVDELSKLKAGGAGFKRLRRVLEGFKWRVGMTGTPVAEDFEGLFYQVYAVDGGKAFGRSKERFLRAYFDPDFNEYDWTLKPTGGRELVGRLAGLVYTVPDYRAELPELTCGIARVELPSGAREVYAEMAAGGVAEIEGEVQTAANLAVLSGKLAQLASGALYLEGSGWRVAEVHSAKVREVVRLVGELGPGVIVCYWYKHELARLEAVFPDAINLNDPGAVEAWNAGAGVMLVQPMSCSHGLQLQFGGGAIVWFGPVWSNDIRQQMIARVWRKGRVGPVRVVEIVAAGTVDELIIDRVAGKERFDIMFRGFST